MTNKCHLTPSCEMYKTNQQHSSGIFARVRAVLFLGSISVHPFPSPPTSIGDKFFPKSVKKGEVIICHPFEIIY